MSEIENTNLAKKEKKPRKKLNWLTKLILLVDVCAAICFFVVYGPYEKIREWYILTAITSGQHKYLAYIFYNNEQIDDVINKNRIMYTGGTSDPDMITIVDNPNTGVYANAYEREILEHDPDQDYKLIIVSKSNSSTKN